MDNCLDPGGIVDTLHSIAKTARCRNVHPGGLQSGQYAEAQGFLVNTS